MSFLFSSFCTDRAMRLQEVTLTLAACTVALGAAVGCSPAKQTSAAVPEASTPVADAAIDDAEAGPTCEPTAATDFDAGTAGSFAGEAGAPCQRDIDCTEGSFCVVVFETCAAKDMIVGAGSGGHAKDGGACVSAPALAASCDGLSLDWSVPQNISESGASLAESDVGLATNGQGTVVVGWANNTKPTNQFNGIAASKDDGATFSIGKGPAQASSDTENDVELAVDGSGLIYQVWQEFGPQEQGAQHIYAATSHDGVAWSTPWQVDPAADSNNGKIPLDFPDLAVNPVSGEPYFTYQVTSSTGAIPIRLVVGGGSGAPAASSVELDDGTRPGSYRDLANGAFDGAGSFYAAWVELSGSGGSTGMGLESGDPGNAIYTTRLDPSGDSGVSRSGSDVLASGSGEAVLFGLPKVQVSPDGANLYILYEVGSSNAIDLRVATSHDRGRTFSASMKVNDDSTCATHFKASAALDAKGRLWVLWYDNRDGAGHVVYSVSDDGAKTFHPNRLVTPYDFPFETFQYSVGWLGDYLQVVTTPEKIYAAWSDPHAGDRSHVNFVTATLP